jgi:hypothetical protein
MWPKVKPRISHLPVTWLYLPNQTHTYNNIRISSTLGYKSELCAGIKYLRIDLHYTYRCTISLTYECAFHWLLKYLIINSAISSDNHKNNSQLHFSREISLLLHQRHFVIFHWHVLDTIYPTYRTWLHYFPIKEHKWKTRQCAFDKRLAVKWNDLCYTDGVR